jgi:hypothetical protein
MGREARKPECWEAKRTLDFFGLPSLRTFQLPTHETKNTPPLVLNSIGLVVLWPVVGRHNTPMQSFRTQTKGF